MARKFQINRINLYDALSIDRWQHWSVLGRDTYTEVVYKGFLFPLGFRASLVKIRAHRRCINRQKGQS